MIDDARRPGTGNSDDDVVVRYAARILALKAERDAAVDDDELLAIARDLGMSDADLKAVAAAAAAHVVRARGYREHGRLADAIGELEQATALSPRDPVVLFALADALKARFLVDGDTSDAARARVLARACLAVAPDHRPSFAVLNELDARRPAKRALPRVAIAAGVGAAVFVAVGAAVFVTRLLPTRVVQAGSANATPPDSRPSFAQAAIPGSRAPGGAGVEPPATAAAATEPNETGTFDLPVTLVDDAHSVGLQLGARHSVLSRYADSAFYELHALVASERAALIARIDWKLEVLDRAGGVVTTMTMEGPASHDAALRPGDTQALSRLVPTTVAAASVRLTVMRIEEEPLSSGAASGAALPKPPASAPIELHWAIDKPAGVDVVVRERSRSLSPKTFSLGPFLGATWQVENTGSIPVRLLKVDVRVFDAAGKALSIPGPFSTAKYVTAPSQASLRVGDIRLIRTTIDVPDAYARYELWVTELN